MNRLTLHLRLVLLCALACTDLSGGCSRSEGAPARVPVQPRPLRLADVPPAATLEFLRFETRGDSLCAVVRLTNRAADPLWYFGYPRDGGVPKLYPEFCSEAKAAWGDRFRGCGFGTGRCRLAPGQSIESQQCLSRTEQRPIRIGVFYRMTETSKERDPIAWTPRIVPPHSGG